jgi:hypothetical protein
MPSSSLSSGSSSSSSSAVTALQRQAEHVKEEVLTPLRAMFGCPSTPRGGRQAASFVKGMGKSAKDLIDLPGVLLKLGLTAGESLVKWKDHFGLQSAQEAISTLLSTTKQDWEHPEAYLVRMEAASAYRCQL